MPKILFVFLIALLLPLASPSVAGDTFRNEFLGASDAALDNPHDIKLSPDGEHLFVSDVDNNRVAVLDAKTLRLVDHFGSDHQGGTHDVDFDKAGRLYVADTHNGRVTIYEISGTRGRLVGALSERIRGPGRRAGASQRPHLCRRRLVSGNLVVYEDGQVVGEMKGLSSPHDVGATPEGDIWLADAGNDRMLLLTPGLQIIKEI